MGALRAPAALDRLLPATGPARGRVDSVDPTTGEVVRSYSTDDEPDGTLLKCCGNRREAVCPSCARTYRGDAFQLVATGMRGGKGVPETVAEHPLVFLTLTAPSFGPVHSRRVVDGKARRCRPRRDGETCPHGVPIACGEVHDEDDPRLGEPICPECFDYEHAVLWNALAPELWRRTAIQLPRELARLRGVKPEAAARARVLRQGRRVPAPRRAALPLRAAPRRRQRGRRARGTARASYGARAADRRGDSRRRGTCRSSPPLRDATTAAGCGPRARSAGARRSRCASSTTRGGGRGVVRGLHRQVRDQVHRGRRRADVPARRRRRRSA